MEFNIHRTIQASHTRKIQILREVDKDLASSSHNTKINFDPRTWQEVEFVRVLIACNNLMGQVVTNSLERCKSLEGVAMSARPSLSTQSKIQEC